MKYPRSLATTWETTVAHLDFPARGLLRMLACLAPDPIPGGLLRTEEARQVLSDAAASLGRERREEPCDALAALAELAAYSLVQLEASGEFTMHRLVQDVTRSRTPSDERRDWIDRALRLVDAYAPAEPDDVRTWPVWD